MSPAEAKYRESRLLIFAACYVFTVIAVVIMVI